MSLNAFPETDLRPEVEILQRLSSQKLPKTASRAGLVKLNKSLEKNESCDVIFRTVRRNMVETAHEQ